MSIKGASVLKFLKKKEKKKINKYEQISPESFVKLAEKSPTTASKQMRERYKELSDYANSHAVTIYKDHNLKGWYRLANLLAKYDPVLAKTILMPLLRTRNFKSRNEIPDDLLPDMRLVAQQLHDLEKQIPEKTEEAKLNVHFVLVNYGFPDQPFWQSCLEEMFELAVKLTNNGDNYVGMIAYTAFYARNGSELQKKALDTFRLLLKERQLFKASPKHEWHKACLIGQLFNFCVQKNYITRNQSFPANPKAKLCKLLYELFWKIVEIKLEEKSAIALTYLEKAMESDDAGLSCKAAEVYKKYYEVIAKTDPKGATENLKSLAVFSTCIYSASETKHQNDLLMDVFDVAIEALYKIDKELAQKPFQAFMGSHRTMPYRIRKKHECKITRWV